MAHRHAPLMIGHSVPPSWGIGLLRPPAPLDGCGLPEHVARIARMRGPQRLAVASPSAHRLVRARLLSGAASSSDVVPAGQAPSAVALLARCNTIGRQILLAEAWLAPD